MNVKDIRNIAGNVSTFGYPFGERLRSFLLSPLCRSSGGIDISFIRLDYFHLFMVDGQMAHRRAASSVILSAVFLEFSEKTISCQIDVD